MGKKIVAAILRLAVSAGIIIYVFSKPDIDLAKIAATLKSMELLWLISAFLTFKVAILIASYRWQILMKAHNIKVNYAQAVGLNYLGLFFNNFMLSLTGGDIVKAYYASKLTSGKKAESATIVFIDRLIGFSGLLILGVVATLLGIGNEGIRSAQIIIFAAVGVFVILGVFAFNRAFARKFSKWILIGFPGFLVLSLVWALSQIGHERIRIILAIVGVLVILILLAFRRTLAKKVVKYSGRITETLKKVYDAIYFYKSRKKVLAEAVGLSVLVWISLILINLQFAKGLGLQLSAGYYFIFVPVISIITVIPITIAGWGLRESMYAQFFGGVGLSDTVAVSLSIAIALTMLLWSLVGGVLYALHLPRFTRQR